MTIDDIAREIQALNAVAAALRPLYALRYGLLSADHERLTRLLADDAWDDPDHALRRELHVIQVEGARVSRQIQPLMDAYMLRRAALFSDAEFARQNMYSFMSDDQRVGLPAFGLYLEPIAD